MKRTTDTRRQLTSAEQVTLRLYPTAFILLGFIFIFQSPTRSSGPAFRIAEAVMPIVAWGFVFLTVGLLEVVAMLLWRRRWYAWALTAGAGLTAFWAVLLSASTQQSPVVSYSAPVWILIAVGAQIASARMLAAPGRP